RRGQPPWVGGRAGTVDRDDRPGARPRADPLPRRPCPFAGGRQPDVCRPQRRRAGADGCARGNDARSLHLVLALPGWAVTSIAPRPARTPAQLREILIRPKTTDPGARRSAAIELARAGDARAQAVLV